MARASTWQQGEHLSIIGDTGSGKTYLESHLLSVESGYRDYVIVLKSKADPDDRENWRGYKFIRSASDIGLGDRYFLHPAPDNQRSEFATVLRMAYLQGGWTVVIDELYFAEHELRLGQAVNTLLTQGRSLGVTVVVGMQRPVLVSRFALSQCTHTFCFSQEGRDAKTVAEATTPRLAATVESLKRYQFAYYNRRTRELIVSDAKRLDRLLTAQRGVDHARAHPH